MEEPTFSKLIKQSIWRFFLTILTKSGALIFVMIIARFLKPEGFGIYNLAMSILPVFLIMADIGINQTLLRYFSFALGKKSPAKAASYLKYLLKIKMMITFSLAVLLLLLSYPLSIYIFRKPELFLPLVILSFYLILMSFEAFYEKIFYVIKQVKYLTIKEIFFQILRILLALAVFSVVAENNRVVALSLSLFISILLTFLLILWFLKRLTPYIYQKSEEKIDKKKVLTFLKYMVFGSLTTVFFLHIDVIMLGIFLKSEYIGFYSAAFTLMESIVFTISFSWVIMPTFTQLKESKLNEAFDRVLKYICLLSIPISFGTIVLAKYFIRLIYGYNYLPAQTSLIILAPLIFGFVFIDIIVVLFSSREKPKYFVKMLVIATILNLILNYTFIRICLGFSSELAIAGVAAATLISNSFYLVSLVKTANKRLKIVFEKKYFLKPLFASLVMFLALISINHLIIDMNFFLGIGEIFAGALIYFLVMILIKGVGKEDLLIIKEVLKRRHQK